MVREYRDFFVGMTPLTVRTHFNEEDGFLMGALHTRRGWHWHFSCDLPYLFRGQPVTNGSVVQGPFDTEELALEDAAKHLNGNYHLPVRPARCNEEQPA